ncbi:hypothetical protein BDV98DRAFT_562284 [Pterulicium gracile]|uniref:C2H2-type domain-containing protein n=1 Tax=Pterulicium gracile TaxID=1884261 RepID=A0A5C3QSZ8_9AGAR|nr:hypothetical protein BDV98DRAFT_562284 [Pterula gracilis]
MLPRLSIRKNEIAFTHSAPIALRIEGAPRSRRWQCTHCATTFARQSDFGEHGETHAVDASTIRFKCRHDGCKFSAFEPLRCPLHTLPCVVFIDGVDWGCSHCEIVFRRKDNFSRHAKTWHKFDTRSGEYKCSSEGCEFSTIQKEAFTTHEEEHRAISAVAESAGQHDWGFDWVP